MDTIGLKNKKENEPASRGLSSETNNLQSDSHSSSIKIGIVGLRFGLHILELLRKPDARKLFKPVGVCDLREDVAKKMADKVGGTAYTSLDELLRNDEIDVVGLFTPPENRSSAIRKIIRAGKDVLTTKPFELDVNEARTVLEEARELGRVIHLNSPGISPTRDIRIIEHWIGKHQLGKPIGGQTSVWASYHESADGTWADNPFACPAAPLLRLGIYLFNDLSRIFGPAESIQLMTTTVRTQRPTPDNAQVNIQFRNKAIGHVFASFCVDDGNPYRFSMALHFEKGSIYRNVGAPLSREPEPAELVLVRRTAADGQVLEHATVAELTGDYDFKALFRAVRMREIMDDTYMERILESVRLIAALRRAQPNGMTMV